MWKPNLYLICCMNQIKGGFFMFKNRACMYLRLSKDDGVNEESNSITNQREIVKSYARKNEIELVKEYIDDGYSGLNFDRPEFKEMIEEISKEERIFDTIIVKDLSRFSRDYIGSGRYIQRIFPEIGIRFISINDNYDSQNADSNDTHLILPIRNFINDSYCRIISNSVKSSQKIKREQGQYIGSFAPYGYKKSEENKNKLIIDENVREIVKSIFDMKLLGYSSKAIGDELNRLGVDSPKVYKQRQGLKYLGGFKTTKGGNWSAHAINRIIQNEVYLGKMQQGKSVTISYKNRKQVEREKSDWIVVENTHEAIISQEIFQIANVMLKRDLNTSKYENEKSCLFRGMLFCKDCGSPLVRRTVNLKRKTTVYYICSKYNKQKACSRHSVKEEVIEKILLEILKRYILFNKKLYEKVKNIDFSKNIEDTQILLLQREKEMAERLLSDLYIDLEENIISKEEYQIFRKNYLQQVSKLEENIRHQEEKRKLVQKNMEEKKQWIIDIKKYGQLTKLDRLSIVLLIEKILVGESKEMEVIFNHKEELNLITNILCHEKEIDKTEMPQMIQLQENEIANISRELKTVEKGA